MKILVSSIKEICNNGEFTTIVLTSGDCIHTPPRPEGYEASISFTEIESPSGELHDALSIDITPIESMADLNDVERRK